MDDVQCLDKTSRVKYFDDSQQYEEHCGSQENLVVAETRNPVTFREPLLFCKWVASRPHLLFGRPDLTDPSVYFNRSTLPFCLSHVSPLVFYLILILFS